MFIDIIDIGSGNIKSIQNWIEKLNVFSRIVTKSSDLKSEFVILPGVGSAGSYMKRLKSSKFDKAIIQHINKNGRIMGICLGFQILGHYSEEDGKTEGLGIIEFYTEKLNNNLPHNGWEELKLNKNNLNNQSFKSKLKLTKKQKLEGRVFYNHEYGVVCDDKSVFNQKISDQYSKYSALIIKDNIIGVQFHPEKSQQTGLDIMSMIL